MRRNRVNSQSAETKRTADSITSQSSNTDLNLSNTDIHFPGETGENMARQILLVARRSPGQSADTAGEDAPLRLFGILMGTVRRKRGYRLEDLALRTGLPVELIAAIELGAATYDEIIQAIRPLGDALGNQYIPLSRALVEMTLG